VDAARPLAPQLQAAEDRPATWGPRGRHGWIFSAIWLVYLGNTLAAAWDLHSPTRRAAGVAIVIVFGAYYLRVFFVARILRWRGNGRVPPATQALALATGTGLTLLACAVIGQAGTALAVFLSVVAVLVLQGRLVPVAVLLIIGATELATRVVPGWTPDDSLAFSVFLAALAVWGITQVITRNRQLAEANEEITELAIAQERSRFSRDLHDLLGHSLTVVAVKAELAGRLVDTDPERAKREISDVEQLARTALADVRAAVRGVREVSLAVELASARTALEAADIEASIPSAVDDIPADRNELFGWVVREGVTNVVRHSGARRCTILVDSNGVQISDDGRGPLEPGSEGAPHHGSGLTGLHERAQAAGARLSVGRATGGGFLLRVGW
jgi:two-component system sensor histidine kinase DesK